MFSNEAERGKGSEEAEKEEEGNRRSLSSIISRRSSFSIRTSTAASVFPPCPSACRAAAMYTVRVGK
jgi:hypothetical protein